MQGLLTWRSKFLVTYKHLRQGKRYQISCVFMSTKLKRDAFEELALSEAKEEALCKWPRPARTNPQQAAFERAALAH